MAATGLTSQHCVCSWRLARFASFRPGEGTLAPWDPPRKLVVRGSYGYVRNPMFSGVLSILAGEAIFFGSLPVLKWCGFFAVLNAIYIPLVEEPMLVGRFGHDYLFYKKLVRRWIPRLTPWDPETKPSNLANLVERAGSER